MPEMGCARQIAKHRLHHQPGSPTCYSATRGALDNMWAWDMSRSHESRDAAALLLVVVLVRGALCVFPPASGLLNVDELEAVLAGVDRWLGVPSSVLAWPAGVTQLLVQPYLLLSFLFQLAGAHPAVPVAFAHHIAGLYLEPAWLITAVRLMGALLSAVAVAAMYLAGRSIGLGRAAGLVATVFWLLSPIAFDYSVMATGDGIAWSLALISVFVAVKWPRRVTAAGALLGCALASKITVALLVILPLGLIVARPREEGRSKILEMLAFGGGVAVAFVVLCPQVWIAPLQFAKSIVGNFLFATVDSTGPLPLFNRLVPAGLAAVALVLGIVAMVLVPARRRLAVPLFVASLVMILPLIGRPLNYLRYAVPVMIPLSLLAGIAYEGLIAPRQRDVRAIAAAVVGLASVLLAWLTFASQREMRNVEDLRPLLAELRTCTTNHRTILLPLGLYTWRFWRLPANRGTWEGALPRSARDVVGSPAAEAFLVKRGLPRTFVQVFWASLTDREQAYHARLRALATVDNPGSCSAKFYVGRGDELSRRSPLYELEEDEAVNQFTQGGGRFILVTRTLPDDLHSAPPRFGSWYVLGSR